MTSCRKLTVLMVGLCAAVLVAACSATSAGNTSTPTNTPPTATTAPKPKPTSAPKVNEAFCQSVMTVAEANQIMHPPIPATTIRVQSDAELGVCSYIYSQSQLAVVKILVEGKPYTGPKPVPESTIIQLVSQLENEPGVTVTTKKPVSGVGDQAEFLAAYLTNSNITFYVDAIYVIYGKVAFMCDDFHLNTKPDDVAQLNGLQQCAERVVSRL